MPTKLSATLPRRRDTRAQAPTDGTIMLACVIVNLAMLVLLFLDQPFAQSLQLMGLY